MMIIKHQYSKRAWIKSFQHFPVHDIAFMTFLKISKLDLPHLF